MAAPTTVTLSFPVLADDADTLTVALALAAAGIYVLPCVHGTKDPGSILGRNWQSKSSRDPEQIIAWFAGTNWELMIHCGRSGLLVFDVDTPDQLPELIGKHLPTAPFQSTRADVPERGHAIFAMPPGRTFGNSLGRLPKGWGEIRGLNGVVKCFPSSHDTEGGRYLWSRTGPVPFLPDELAGHLDDASPSDDAATDAQVSDFLTTYTGESRPELLAALTKALAARYKSGESRHHSTTAPLTGAMKEAKAGYYPAHFAAECMREMFLAAVAKDPVSTKQKKARTGRKAEGEFAGLLAWAVGQANATNVVDITARIAEKMPEQSAPIDNVVLPPAIELDEARAVFRRWLGEDYDTDALDAELAAAAVEKFTDGSDPVWLLIISGSGAAKTETARALVGVGAKMTSSITGQAALLSATAKRDRAKDHTGGLLRRIGDRGVLIIKDVTSILSMNNDARAEVMAALREVYDGAWTREVGAEGGRLIPWSGRIAIVGACTTAWDTHHSVIASMGDRFVLVRIDSHKARKASGRKAIGNTGSEKQMREELAAAVGGVIAGMDPDPPTITEEEGEVILAATDLITLTRTAVEYDYRGDVIDAHAPEAPTRLTKQLTQIMRGAIAIGMSRADALKLAIRIARDTVPPLRLAILEDLVGNPMSTPTDVRRRMDKPRATIDRQLQALHYLGLVTLDEVEECYPNGKSYTKWHYTLNDEIDPGVLKYPPKPLPENYEPVYVNKKEKSEESTLKGDLYLSGNGSGTPDARTFFATATASDPHAVYCRDCHSKLPRGAIKRGFCDDCIRGEPNVYCSGCGIKLPNRESATRGTCYECHTATTEEINP